VDLGVKYPSLPTSVMDKSTIDTRDTPENRFVKYVLQEFVSILWELETRFVSSDAPANQRILNEVFSLKQKLETYLALPLFREVGDSTYLPLASPVLQNRSGYREILQTWFKLNLVSKLAWSGGEDVFGAGKKDIAVLYEYWLYFVLLEIVSELVQVDVPVGSGLFDVTNAGIDIRLKSGTHLALQGRYDRGSRPISARFSYNRTFSGQQPSEQKGPIRPGSWTQNMRPDYTISLWPAAMSENEAEDGDQIVHIHFDAKYRVDNLVNLFGSGTNDELIEEATAYRNDTKPKRSDLLKMHAYRDSIRRTEGAYVLYPGSQGAHRMWRQFHEILPGLGAFSVHPSTVDESKSEIGMFLQDILANVSERNTN
jgi:predicted component of viral defense system (DUF524 family)